MSEAANFVGFGLPQTPEKATIRRVNQPPLYPVYPIETLRHLVEEATRRYQRKNALLSKKNGVYEPVTFAQMGQKVAELATGYFTLGLGKGDRLAVLSENRTEWAIAYLAAVSSGLAVVPIDRDLKRREIRHILDYSGATVLVCGGEYVSQIGARETPLKGLKTIVSMEDEKRDADLSYLDLIERGYEALRQGDVSYEESRPGAEDVAAIIFTSGTMGSSKAVTLSHHNLCSNIMATSQMVSISNDDTLLSVLPLHHTYECTCGFLTALYQGATIYHAENLRRISENLVESKATVMLGVPLLFETIYRRIEKGIKEKGEAKFRFAKNLAKMSETVFRRDIRRRLFKSLHEKFGGRLRLLISGGAAINPDVARGFRELGINFIQGYGMTECSPLIAVNREKALRDDSAGLPIPGIELKFVDGEILARGPSVMPGYYLNPAATAEALRDGWLHTGDLGHLDEDGFLYISGRKKSLIVTPNGKNVYPEEVEAVLNSNPHILESLVWGGPESDPSLVEVQAMIVPDLEAFDREFGASRYDTTKIEETIGEAVKAANRELAGYKRIKKFTLREEEFEKTTTRKIKRYLYTGKPQPLNVGR